jgi:UDP-2,3-diacylglucosamine pyrophosphatase LpxH
VPRALRTLVISDLHLGNRGGNDVLRWPTALAVLLDALADIDRLVLLGDLAELMTRNPRRPLAAAEPVLRAIGARMGPDREVVLVPGNHDAPLIRAWARAQGSGLTIDGSVPVDATRALALVVSWLAPARVRVHYPGVWLSEGVFATHGHYLDHHLLPESAFGVLRWGADARRSAVVGPSYYERTRRRVRSSQRSFLERLIERPFPTLLEGGAHMVRATAVPAVPRLLLNVRLAPVNAALVDMQMRHASIPAMQRVVTRLGVRADWVVFGHVHRAGPLAGDSLERWSMSGNGGPRYVNTGSWLYEPLLVDRSSPPRPYWPGGAVLLEPGRDPQVVGLLDGLGADGLRQARR